MKRTGFLLLIIIVLIACGQSVDQKGDTPNNSSTVSVETNFTTHERLSVVDFEGLQRDYLDLQNDTTYVINFWATWCKPCVKELPYFEELGATYKDKKVKVVLVSLDFPENIETKVLPFIEKERLQSEVVLLDDTDANTWIPKVDPEWQGSIPATLIFKRERKEFFEKQLTLEDLTKTIESIL